MRKHLVGLGHRRGAFSCQAKIQIDFAVAYTLLILKKGANTMHTLEIAIDYDTYDNKHKSAHNRHCIDATITGSGNCVAYCEYEGHPGFLTEKLRSEHECVKKECIYYLPKTQKYRRNHSNQDVEQKRILEMSQSVTSDMEGLRVMRANRDIDGSWSIYYISIAEYFFDSASRIIEENTGVRAKFVDLGYRFEIAAELIFGIKSA